MEKLVNCETTIDIEWIENVSGGDRFFEVAFSTKDKKKYKIILKHVWDMRWSIENASIDRFCAFRKNLPEGMTNSSVYLVENSEYIKYFENQVSGTRPIDELKHYIFLDKTDNILYVLTVESPIVVEDYSTEQIVIKLEQIDSMRRQGKTLLEAIQQAELTEQVYYRWLSEYGNMDANGVKKLKKLEKEIAQIKQRVAELSLENAMLKAVA